MSLSVLLNVSFVVFARSLLLVPLDVALTVLLSVAVPF